jgi:hypothetical protein
MPTEVFFRDPHNYVRELVECGQMKITWNRGVLLKRSIDPVAWAELYYGAGMPVRQFCVGSQGTAEVGPGRPLNKPIAVYPTWTYGDPLTFLEDMLAEPIGQDMKACTDINLPPDERPVFNQEHIVFVTGMPPVNTGPGRSLLAMMKRMQEDYPEAKMFVHGMYSFKYAFGMGFWGADIEPRNAAAQGSLQMAGGGEIKYQKVQSNPQWVSVVGMTPGELDSPRGRCIFNIKSAVWAGAHLDSMRTPKTAKSTPKDITTPDEKYEHPRGQALPRNTVARVGDKVLCDMCSLQLSCKQFRQGEVCSLTDSETGKLAKMFGTRDSQSIVDGLQQLAMLQANRLERAASIEHELDDISPEVSKLINSLFSQGVTLAKLLDPSLRGGGVKVQVGVVNGQATAAVSTSTPAELTGQVVRALEQQGIKRENITPDLVMATLKGMADRDRVPPAIEGAVIAELAS